MKRYVRVISVLLIILTFASCAFALFDQPTSHKGSSTIKQEVDLTGLTYVAFGDSITYGIDGLSTNERTMANPYPKLVGKILNLKSVDNRGVSGATFCSNNQGLTVETDIITSYKKDADIISVLLGVNDYNRSLPLGKKGDTTNATIYGSLYLISEYLTKNYRDSFIFFMTPFKEYYQGKVCTLPNSAGYTLLDVVNAIKDVANDYDIPVLDLYHLGGYEKEMYLSTSDGIHPSQQFFEKNTAPQIANFIKQNY